jgi:hypothetical protein
VLVQIRLLFLYRKGSGVSCFGEGTGDGLRWRRRMSVVTCEAIGRLMCWDEQSHHVSMLG